MSSQAMMEHGFQYKTTSISNPSPCSAACMGYILFSSPVAAEARHHLHMLFPSRLVGAYGGIDNGKDRNRARCPKNLAKMNKD